MASISDFAKENPEMAIIMVAGVAVVFVLMGGKKANPNNTPAVVPNAPGTDYVSNGELINALNDQEKKILKEVQPPNPPGGQAVVQGYMSQYNNWQNANV